MNLFIILALASFGIMGVMCQGGGGGYGHEEEERGDVIGLSRGIEVGRHRYGEEREREREHERERERERHEGGGGGGGGGGEIGFGGSHFITPVEIHHEDVVHLKAHPEFRYGYRIEDHKTKDYHSKEESREGYKVKGRYTLWQPDHRVRVVDYTSDKKRGFIARVSYRKHD